MFWATSVIFENLPKVYKQWPNRRKNRPIRSPWSQAHFQVSPFSVSSFPAVRNEGTERTSLAARGMLLYC
jgi:hypothetical protein